MVKCLRQFLGDSKRAACQACIMAWCKWSVCSLKNNVADNARQRNQDWQRQITQLA